MRLLHENKESTRRQYALRERAEALGWQADQIVVIDSDLGMSGAADREGFNRLMAEIALGNAGIVLKLEVSRLARNDVDWHRLLELCGTFNTLILDEDGLYCPCDYNDRLLLGLKGAMSTAELHILRSRMQGGIVSKAKRGTLRLQLPTGLVYDAGHHIRLDPDSQLRNSIRQLFSSFERVGSCYGVARHFRDHGLMFPKRDGRGFTIGQIHWKPLTATRTRHVLRNPRYAGAFAYGRCRNGRSADAAQPGAEDAMILIRDVHPGYISWQQFQSNAEVLAANSRASRQGGPAREGSALLQGIALCGFCGRGLHIQYRGGGGKQRATYYCRGHYNYRQKRDCQTLSNYRVDEAVGQRLIELVTPTTLQAAMRVQEDMQARDDEIAKLRDQTVQRCREAAELARRRCRAVDPDNRLVLEDYEREFNQRLQELRNAEQQRDRLRQQDKIKLDRSVRQRIVQLATDFPRLWNDPATPNREKKRRLRRLVEDVTVTRRGGQAHLGIRLRSGMVDERQVELKSARRTGKFTDAIVAEIAGLLHHHTDAGVAKTLNQRGRTGKDGQPFTGSKIVKGAKP